MYIRGQRKHVAAAAAAAAPNSAQLPHHFLRSRFTFITDLFFFQVCSSIYKMVPPMLYSYYQFSPIRITYARSLVSIIAISYSNIDNELYYQDDGDTFNILITPPTTTSPLPSLTEPTYIQAYIHSNRYRNKCIRICMSAYVCTPDLAVHDTYYLHTWIFQYTTLGVGTP